MSNHHHLTPRRGSAAHIAIIRVVQLGGTAKFCHIIERLRPEHQTLNAFRVHVIAALQSFGLAETIGDQLRATSKGKEYAGRFLSEVLPVAQPYVGQIVPARSVVSTATLDVNRLRHTRPIRPGADDHLQIPSLMGNTRKLPSGEVIG